MQRLALNLFIFGALLVAVPTHAQVNKDKIDAGSSELSRIMGGNDQNVTFDLTDDVSAIENVNAGLSDAALVTGSLDALIKETNQGSPDPLKKSNLKAEKVGEIALSFVVNKNNPVQRLSKKQIKDIFSGKVTNWQSLGGPDLPITLVAQSGDPVFELLVKKKALEEETFAVRTRSVMSADQVKILVSIAGQALGVMFTADVDESVARVSSDLELKQPVYLITKKDAGEKAQRINQKVKAKIK